MATKRWVWRGALVGSLLSSMLACGGAGGSVRAQTFCDVLESQNDAPCTPLDFGDFAEEDGIRVAVKGVRAGVVPESSNNSWPDRDKLRATGSHALIVDLEVENTQVTAVTDPFALTVLTGAGTAHTELWGSTKDFNAQHGLADAHDPIRPGSTVQMAAVIPVPAAEKDGVLISLVSWEKKPDPQDPLGRKKQFAVQQFAMEAPAAAPL